MFVFASIGSSSGSSSVVGPSNVLYVDVAGVDATGVRGNAARPFLTPQAAINAALTGDQIRFGPGVFACAATLVIPAATTRLSFWGCGSGPLVNAGSMVTQLTGPAAGWLFDLGVNLGLSNLNFQDMALSPGSAQMIRADGSGYAANGFIPFGVQFVNCSIIGVTCLDLKYTRNWRFVNCIVNGIVNIVDGGIHIFEQCQIGGSAHTYSYDGTNPLRTSTQLAVIMRGPGLAQPTGALNIIMSGQARLWADTSFTATSITGNLLSVSGALRPSIVYSGSVGTIDFQSTAAKMLPDTTVNSMTLDFSGCVLTGASALFEVTAPATAQIVNMTGVTGSAAAQTIRANAGIALTARGNAFRAPTYVTAGTGTINPGQLNFTVALAGAVQACPLGFTSPVTTYVAQASPDVFATGLVACVGHAATTFNLQSAAGGGNARVSVTWP